MNIISSVLIVVGSFGLVSVYDHTPVMRYFIESLLRVDDVANTKLLMLHSHIQSVRLLTSLYCGYISKRFSKEEQNHFSEKHSCNPFLQHVLWDLRHTMHLECLLQYLTKKHFWYFPPRVFAGIVGIIFGIFILGLMKMNSFFELKSTLHSKF